MGYMHVEQHFTPFATTFQQDPLRLYVRVHGKKANGQSSTHSRSNARFNNIFHPTRTFEFIVDEPIYFSGSGIRTKRVFCELKIVGDLSKKCQALIKLQAYKP